MKLESAKSIFAKAVFRAFLIGIGGIVYLVCENKWLGGFLFLVLAYFVLFSMDLHYLREKWGISPKTSLFICKKWA